MIGRGDGHMQNHGWKPRGSRVTIEDVARAASVSRQTVSRAINDKGEIDPATRVRVLDAAQRLGYRPNRFARGMVSGAGITLGLLVPHLRNPYFPQVADSVVDSAAELGWTVVVHHTRSTVEGERSALAAIERQADAFVGYLEHRESLVRAEQCQMPFVLFGGEDYRITGPRLARVDVDFRHGMRLALGHLGKAGHSRIGFLDVRKQSAPREPSPRAATLLDLVDDEFDIALGTAAESTVEAGAEGARGLLAEHPDITAIMTYNDIVGIGAARAVMAAGLRIPEDCAIVGFDGLDVADLVDPPLTTLRVDLRRLGRESVRLVERAIGGSADEPAAVIAPTLVVRRSTVGE